MKLSALIHCRTFYFDFNTKFLVRPSDFTSDDIKWARKHILSATSYCDELDGKRYIVFNNSRYCIFGIVSLLNDALKMLRFPEQDIEKFSYDENRRQIKCFFGFVFHVSDKHKGEIPEITEKDYYELLNKFVVDETVFFSKTQPGNQVDYYIEKDFKQVVINCTDDFYCMSSETADEGMFKRLLSDVSFGANINFCSNIYNLKMLEEGQYNYFTSNQHTIQRYTVKKKEAEKKAQEAFKQAKITEQDDKEVVKKKDVLKAVFVVGVIIFLVLIILF